MERLEEDRELTDRDISLVVWLMMEHAVDQAARPLMALRSRTETEAGEDSVDHTQSSRHVMVQTRRCKPCNE